MQHDYISSFIKKLSSFFLSLYCKEVARNWNPSEWWDHLKLQFLLPVCRRNESYKDKQYQRHLIVFLEHLFYLELIRPMKMIFLNEMKLNASATLFLNDFDAVWVVRCLRALSANVIDLMDFFLLQRYANVTSINNAVDKFTWVIWMLYVVLNI